MDSGVITTPDDPQSITRRTLSIGGIEFDGEANSGDEENRLRDMDLGTGWGTCSAFDIVSGNPSFFRPNSWCVYKVDPETGTGTIVASLVNPGCSLGQDECNSLFKGVFIVHSDGDAFYFFADGGEGGPPLFISGVATRR